MVIVDALLQDSVARFLSPALARGMIDGPGGQDAYALMQVAPQP